ncbi:hypothetical protein T492DRAFT_985697 [Pavlovales sp. CCMP2436]|nr:hypothetical protein T492DRAFT_985697 [Pavlovales sp. CCMP2436]
MPEHSLEMVRGVAWWWCSYVSAPPREHAAHRGYTPAHTRRRAGWRGVTSSPRPRVKTAMVARVFLAKRAQTSSSHPLAAIRYDVDVLREICPGSAEPRAADGQESVPP